jgi:hypothetical protein
MVTGECRAAVDTVMNVRILRNVVNFLNSWVTGDFWRRTQLYEVSMLAENGDVSVVRGCHVRGADHNCFSRCDLTGTGHWIHLAYNQSSHRVLWNYFCYSRSQACVLNHTSLHSGRCVHGNITWHRGHILFIYVLVGWGQRSGQATMLQTGRSRVRFPMRWFFKFTKSFRPH